MEISKRIKNLVEKFTERSGTTTHPNEEVTEAVMQGLTKNIEDLGKPLCPCRFYPDKMEEIKSGEWICPCSDMMIYKYCHCLLFVNEDGMPITEYLPEGHEGRKSYGFIKDPTPDKGRVLRHTAAEREEIRKKKGQ